MRLHIEHTTTYDYTRPVQLQRHRLVLRPREGHDLRIERMHLHLEPAHRLHWIRDVFGNSIALVDWLEPSDRLTIVNDVVVERVSPFPSRELHEPWRVPFPPRYDALEAAVTAVYAAPSYPEDVPAVQAWLGQVPAADPSDAEGTILGLCQHVFRTVKYRRRSEKGVQSPAETLVLKTGSCRDMATLMMEAARLWSVAARFASGYFHCAASMAGHASTHAWTEVYLPSLGWRGFDPTLGEVISPSHVVVGVSSHPRGVMPISGTFVGTAADCRGLQVDVKTRALSVEP
jgi:transglutaminase-like putative cysteine protease